jgi:UDP-N-acetylmuramoylalanine--D-glutamate ligase
MNDERTIRHAPRATRFAGKRVLVVGLGVEGVALTRFLAGCGADVTVNDAKSEAELAGRLAELVGVKFVADLGGHDPEAAADHDEVFVSQGVPLDNPLVAEARWRGVPVSSIATLLFEICAGPIVGITGSAGKTTTTSLVAAAFARSGRPYILTGNIGAWPLEALAGAGPETWVVAEISHTQLQLTRRSPHVACVTNVTPNHLDQFRWDEYVDLKRNIVRHQTPRDVAVLNLDQVTTQSFRTDTAAEVLWFSAAGRVGGDGTLLHEGRIVLRHEGRAEDVLLADEIPLRGRHNLENVLAATAAAAACGIDTAVIADAFREFRAVPHRLEVVGSVEGVTYVNDSIATAPERTLAGLRSFAEPLVLLLGGRDKNLPLAELAREARGRCRAVVCFGEAGGLFAGALTDAWEADDPALAPAETPAHDAPAPRRSQAVTGPSLEQVETLPQAVERAARLARPGDVVLLSPAGTSFDAYANFERRGEHFRALVGALQRAPIAAGRPALPDSKDGAP